MDIDIVVTWVDMNDPNWRKELIKSGGSIDNSKNKFTEARFRDHGLLRYWFRGIEKFAPWVRKIHFVTCNQKPEWLNVNHPKLKLVNHSDYIPTEFLPTFSSRVIECHMHKIPGLADHFVYFNDDVFIIDELSPDRFFNGNLPNDIAAFRHNTGIGLWSKSLKNSIKIINERFDKRTVLKRDYNKWFHPSYGKRARLTRLLQPYNKFVTLMTPHNAQPYIKSTFDEVWDYAGDKLTESSKNRFRTANDYTHELFRTWQICKSNFEPYNVYNDTKMFPLVLKSQQAIKALYNQDYKLVCLNDNEHIRDYTKVMTNIEKAFESILPNKSAFEI